MKKRENINGIRHRHTISMSEKIIKQATEASELKTQSGVETMRQHTHVHQAPLKDYRINEQNVYNYVRMTIYDTFKPNTSRNYELMKQFIKTETPQSNLAIERLCKKYSIIRKNKLSCFQNADINVEQIANRYVKSKSKQKQKLQQKAKLKRDMIINYSYGPKKQYRKSEQFFSFEGNHLQKYQKMCEAKTSRGKSQDTRKLRKDKEKQKIKHPYLQLYEKTQMETFNSFLNNKKLDDSPDFQYFAEADEEQKQKKDNKIQKVMEDVRKIRKRQSQSARDRMPIKNNPNFFLS